MGNVVEVEVLISKLARAERQEHHLLSAEVSALLANRLLQEGKYRLASHWAKWALQIYELYQRTNSELYWQNFHQWLLIKLLLGEFVCVQEAIAIKQDKASEFSQTSSWMLDNSLMYLALYRGNFEYAAQIGERLWYSTSQRKHLIHLANPYVRILMSINEEREAEQAAERAMCLGHGLDNAYRAKIILVQAIVLSTSNREKSCELLEQAIKQLSLPWQIQAGLYLVRNYQRLEQAKKAQKIYKMIEPYLQGIDNSGLLFLAGSPLPVHTNNYLGSKAKLNLHFLGGIQSEFKGFVQNLRPRFAEILAVLTSYPKGMSAEQLTLAIYGEAHTSSCCKTEISRLKRLIPIKSRPYRLEIPVWADFLEIPALLKEGQVNKAIDLYQGQLLPASEAPEVRNLRVNIDESLRSAVLELPTFEPLWKLANRMRDDLELWEAVLNHLPRGDPRRSITQARVHSLHRSWQA